MNLPRTRSKRFEQDILGVFRCKVCWCLFIVCMLLVFVVVNKFGVVIGFGLTGNGVV